MVEIHENYKTYVPPRWVRPTVERLLASLAGQHLGDLGAIVLTDSATIGKGNTGRVGPRKRKYKRSECLGFYHHATRNSEAWVELVVDNLLPKKLPPFLLWFQFARDIRIGSTLYHEIGHHLESTIGAATRQGEDAATDWAIRLLELHLAKRYRRRMKLLAFAAPWISRRVRQLRKSP